MSIAPPDLPRDEARCVAPIPVPTHGAGGVFSVACSTTMAAPALACLARVLDLPGYGGWNGFVPEATVTRAGRRVVVLRNDNDNDNDDGDGDDDDGVVRLPRDLADLASRPGSVVPGASVRFRAVMTPGAGGRAVDLEVTGLEAFDCDDSDGDDGDGNRRRKGYRVTWKSVGVPRLLLRSERVQEFVEEPAAAGDGGAVRTRYACWETFGGALAYVLPRASIEDGFRRWMDGLKKAVEEGVAGE